MKFATRAMKSGRPCFDVPPQLSDTDTPYLAFGVRPTAFDAPSIEARDVEWEASTFLVYTPDAVLSRTLRPICGFTWGYRVRGGVVHVSPLSVGAPGDWQRNLPDLRRRFPRGPSSTLRPGVPEPPANPAVRDIGPASGLSPSLRAARTPPERRVLEAGRALRRRARPRVPTTGGTARDRPVSLRARRARRA
jgi:hypothetical protein